MLCDKSQIYLDLLDSIMPYGFKNVAVAQPTLIKGYIDESGSDESQIFTLSCLLGKVSNWGFFINDWLDVLNRTNIRLEAEGRKTLSRYHASDCNSRHGEFQEWSIEEQKQLTAELLKIFHRPSNALNSVGYSIHLNELVEEMPETAPKPKAFAYALLLKAIMQEIGDMVIERNRVVAMIRLPLIHERSPYDAVLLRAFNSTLSDNGGRYSRIFTSITPMGWEDCPFLQPADLLAFENFKEDERHTTGRKRRYTLMKLLDGDVFGGRDSSYDKEGVAKLKQYMTKELRDQILADANIKAV